MVTLACACCANGIVRPALALGVGRTT